MAITSRGFDGSVSAVEFADISQHQGAIFPVVCGRNDLAVAANPAATLVCTIQPGSSAGQGVKTTSDAVASVSFSAVVTSGQTRWDAVVLRRNWSAGGSASFAVVQGTAAASAPMVLPSGVDQVLDSTHDHVLALVQITYGSTVPTQVVDLRAQAHKVFTFPSVSALPTASNALYGMEAVVGDARYRCVLASGSPAWVLQTRAPVTATGVVNLTGNGAPGVFAAVTFPVGRFASPPVVSLTRYGGGPVESKVIPFVGVSVTTAGFTLAVNTGDGSAIPNGTAMTVGWLAVL